MYGSAKKEYAECLDYFSCSSPSGNAERLLSAVAYLSASETGFNTDIGCRLLHSLPFTHELSMLSAREFMQLLHERYNVCALVIGYDHRFGHNRSEGFEDYCRYGEELGMEIIHATGLIEDGVSISSSLIRGLLKKERWKRQIIIWDIIIIWTERW